MKIVQFVKASALYNRGEVAGFDDAEAERYLSAGLAILKSDADKANAAAEEAAKAEAEAKAAAEKAAAEEAAKAEAEAKAAKTGKGGAS